MPRAHALAHRALTAEPDIGLHMRARLERVRTALVAAGSA